MIACKGRTTLKQYMPLKPIKRGIKVLAAACSKTGYLLNFDIYQGKQLTRRPRSRAWRKSCNFFILFFR